jgi:acetyltransferase-like isoleucine patch superfamily enzyme
MQSKVEPVSAPSAAEAYERIHHRLRARLPHAAEEIALQKHLSVQSEDMPDWWHAGNNILVAPTGVRIPPPSYVGPSPPRDATVIVSANCTLPNQILIAGVGSAIFLGAQSNLPNGTIICTNNSMIVLAGNLFAIHAANLDARNGGVIYVGDDNLWSSNVKINTDDMHAIFDHVSLKRLNRFGSIVTVGTHVWLGSDVLINPGAQISDNVVIGSRTIVTKGIPTGCVAVGAPARVIRRRTTWTREDISQEDCATARGLTPYDRGVGGFVKRLRCIFGNRRR